MPVRLLLIRSFTYASRSLEEVTNHKCHETINQNFHPVFYGIYWMAKKLVLPKSTAVKNDCC